MANDDGGAPATQNSDGHRNSFLNKYGASSFKSFVHTTIPFTDWIRYYNPKQNFLRDFAGGIAMVLMHIPQSMSFAMIAGVPVMYGFYASFFGSLAYAFLGTGKQTSVGSYAITSLMAGRVVEKYSEVQYEHGKHSRPQVYASLGLLVGIFQAILWLLRMEILSSLVSDALLGAFNAAVIIQILGTQLELIMGLTDIHIHQAAYKTYINLFYSLDKVNKVSILIAMVAMLIYQLNMRVINNSLIRILGIPLPMMTISLIMTTSISSILDLKKAFNVTTIGPMPVGFPKPSIPHTDLFPDLIRDAALITLVTYTVTIYCNKIVLSRYRYSINHDQEFLAMAVGNILGSLFCSGPVSADPRRSHTIFLMGSTSQMSSMVACGILACIIMWVMPYFEIVPVPALAGVISMTLMKLLWQMKNFPKFRDLGQHEDLVWLVTFVSVIFLDAYIGLIVGICTNFAVFIYNTQLPYMCILGMMPRTTFYFDVSRHVDAEEIPGVKIFHYSGSLNYLGKHTFQFSLLSKIGVNFTRFEEGGTSTTSSLAGRTLDELIRCVILDFTALSYIDTEGIEIVRDVCDYLNRKNIVVYLIGFNGSVKDTVSIFNKRKENKLLTETFLNIHDAVLHYQKSQ